MANVIGVRFRRAGKIYYFDPDGLDIKVGDHVIVETIRGIEYGTVVITNREISEEELVAPLKKVIRIATPEDDEKEKENRVKEVEAFDICKQKIKEHGLEMKLIDVEFTFDNNKIMFYFTAEGRIDFRELVKDLAAIFKTRIELRQIGVRDETKMMGSLGICGRPLCCSSFLCEFQPVSIKMAKDQNLSLNPTKISGVCGRLMCCLKFEEETYREINDRLPDVGQEVMTPDGKGTVLDINVLRELIKVAINKGEDVTEVIVYPANLVTFDPALKKNKTEDILDEMDELDEVEFEDE
ncbi:MAG TPA: stage 0 sporulation family protein [Defluviitaleaceae bacterium]|jgi:cell fate regulator YaaT (PSP1 superfamily)|nr:stage 0 sporulation family protein [Defluviitaleaceae bacterium]HPT76166.1 stage 0 sporulation family protein [Defluviitaleaceae bacterium]HQD50928.1 stage 0 sporulation family protein [Defluviitaleaceae bacterium]